MQDRSHWQAYGLLVFTTWCWGLNTIFSRLAVEQISPDATGHVSLARCHPDPAGFCPKIPATRLADSAAAFIIFNSAGLSGIYSIQLSFLSGQVTIPPPLISAFYRARFRYLS